MTKAVSETERSKAEALEQLTNHTWRSALPPFDDLQRFCRRAHAAHTKNFSDRLEDRPPPPKRGLQRIYVLFDFTGFGKILSDALRFRWQT